MNNISNSSTLTCAFSMEFDDGCDEFIFQQTKIQSVVSKSVQIYPRKNETLWVTGDFLSRLSKDSQIEIHYQGNVFFFEYLNHCQSGDIINLCLKFLTVKKNIVDSVACLPETLLDVSESYVIQDDVWDLIWFGFDGGHMVFYFKKPDNVL